VKRAAFRLQPVLELRRVQEKTAALAAARAAQEAADTERRAREREMALSESRVPASGSAETFVAAMATRHSAATEAAEVRARAAAQAEQAEAVRQLWTAAAQRTRGLERLKDRHAEALLSAERTAEEKAVDDLVTGRAGRRATAALGGPPAGTATDGGAGAQELPWTG
jgi:flagellar export protein FliJ